MYTRNKPPNATMGVGSPTGSLSAGKAKIFSSGSWDVGRSSQLLKDVDTVIAELFHLAAKGRYYTDEELAKAVHNSRYDRDANMPIGPQGQPLVGPTRNIFDKRYIPNPKLTDQEAYSDYFHAIQDKHCSTNPNRKAWYQ